MGFTFIPHGRYHIIELKCRYLLFHLEYLKFLCAPHPNHFLVLLLLSAPYNLKSCCYPKGMTASKELPQYLKLR